MVRSSHHDSSWAPLVAPRARTRTVRAEANGHDYRISVSVPDSAPPPEGFPSLIVLDGGALFQSVADTERRLAHRAETSGVQPTVVIGVSHDGDALYDGAQRSRDFTPGPAVADKAANRSETGGADAFVTFLIDQVLPLAGELAPLDPTRRHLFGHSLAGLFSLHALATRPGVFATHGAVSPSLWWNPDLIRSGLTALSGPAPRLFLAAGALEDPPAGSPKAARRMIGELTELHQALKTAGRIETGLTIFPDENHGSVVLPAAGRYLRFLST
ncbi:alpha/beta hydrolase-fold protein [Brevundimonas kwangchunensis]|uniref:Alpha/beta hydrolase-fold protein n=1 Tax=Brevundimonas kwangchunensis TaxID=322163 RepID=A0ABN1H2W2_9CAUL